MKSKELFPAVFSRHAADYQRRLDDVMSRREASGGLRVVELVDARPGMRVLDLACGPGTLTRRLAQNVALLRAYPGAIQTTGRNHVLYAVA